MGIRIELIATKVRIIRSERDESSLRQFQSVVKVRFAAESSRLYFSDLRLLVQTKDSRPFLAS